MMSAATIYILADHDGTRRDFLDLGILRHLLQLCPQQITLLSPCFREKKFLEQALIDERVTVQPLPSLREKRLYYHWRKLGKRCSNSGLLARHAWRLERHMLDVSGFTEMFRSQPAAAVVLTHPCLLSNRFAEIAARSMGIPSVGMLASWDHVPKGLMAHPDLLGVWNGIDQQGAMKQEGYRAESTRVIGPTSFDPYFWPSTLKPREEFLASMGLDPRKKTILLATGGPIFGLAQASWLEELLEARRQGRFQVPVQFVCRTHPYDQMLQFMKYFGSAEVHLDYHTKFSPVSGWQSDLKEIQQKANLLAWSDVVLTPASTITLEAVVFDTPTVVLAHNSGNPDLVLGVLKRLTFAKHFKPIVERELLPVSQSLDETLRLCNSFLQNRATGRAKRKELVRDWIVFTDGQSARRSAELIAAGVPRSTSTNRCAQRAP